MKFKYLIASAALVIGVAAYTLTLSFTETDLMSQLEALANGEDGESGGGGGNEGENPESGGQYGYTMVIQKHHCQPFRWIAKSDGDGGTNWEIEPIGNGPVEVRVTVCIQNGGPLLTCTPYDPCNPAKPQ